MEQKCFFKGCTKRISRVCHCQKQDTYCCSIHLNVHTKRLDQHNIAYVKKNLSEEEYKDISIKALKGLKYLKDLKKSIRNRTLEILDQVTSASRKAFQMIKNVESGIKHFYSIVSLRKSTNAKQYHWIQNAEFPDKPNEFKLCKHYSKLFNIGLVEFDSREWKECSEILFSSDKKYGGLWSIDLENLKTKKLEYAPEIGAYAAVCKLDKENYFFHGGYRGGYLNESMIVNTEKKRFEPLKSGNTKAYAGSALKDNKVHVFGGYTARNALSSCEVLI